LAESKRGRRPRNRPCRTNDHFWFRFYHELGHLVLHGKKETFLDDFETETDPKEQEANRFARRALSPTVGLNA